MTRSAASNQATTTDFGVEHKWGPKRWKKRPGSRLDCAVCAQSISFWTGFEKCTQCKSIVHTNCLAETPKNCLYSFRKVEDLFTQKICELNQSRWSPSPVQKCQSEPPTTPINSSINLSTSGYGTSATNTPIEKHSIRINKTTTSLDAERLMAPRNVFFGSDDSIEDEKEKKRVKKPQKHRDVALCSQQSTTSDGSASNDQDGGLKPQKQSSITSWDDHLLPLEHLQFGRLIGAGNFGNVYYANHFGQVAVRIAPMQYTPVGERLSTFKRLYDSYRVARHENLVFFCGYTVDEINCHYGIVTEYFHGSSLYNLLHQTKNSNLQAPEISKYVVHICQAMSFLHSKNIIHRDLRSKNVFIQDGRAVVSDYAIFDFYQLQRSKINRLAQLDDCWIVYFAPEIAKNLSLDLEEIVSTIEFTQETDMFAFGTIVYELLTSQFPSSRYATSAEEIRRQVHSLDVRDCWKVFLSTCWQFQAADRWAFTRALDFLIQLPQMGLKRTASLRY
ncbi:hypothetical protein M3Y98_01188500 [Aphelenchoides besseyi]|nr:hypothetical protein M3Y98_01188500 [Aphelenchoides besseyi]KAI6195275.1 hypothetical protein M3Y96_01213600 [Aphelenchoides besseyi]